MKRLLTRKRNQYIFVVAFADLIYLMSGGKTIDDTIIPLATAGFFLWYYKFLMKYGFVNSVGFLVAIPFVLMGSVAGYLGTLHKYSSKDDDDIIRNVSERIASDIQSFINEKYSCKLDRLDRQATGVYIYLTLPFGITPDHDDIIKQLEKDLKFPQSGITFEEPSKQHMYYFVPNTTMISYYKQLHTWSRWEDLHSLIDLLLLRKSRYSSLI